MKQTLQADAGLKPQHIVKHFTDKFLEHEIESVLYNNNAEAYFDKHLHLVTMQVDRRSQKPVTQRSRSHGARWGYGC